jgi:hypothetical protein
MSKAPKKVADAKPDVAPATSDAPAATAPAAEAPAAATSSLDALKAKKAKKAEAPAEVPKAPLDEAIELALASASTAVDSAQEIQRLRTEVQTLITGGRKTNMILLYASILLLIFGGSGLFGALVFYKRAYNEFEAVAKVNRDALLVFAGEVNGLVASSKKIDEAISKTTEFLAASNERSEEVKKSMAGFTAAHNTLIQKLSAPPPVPDTKPVDALRQAVDELSKDSKVMSQRIAELAQKVSAAPAAAAAASRNLGPAPAPVIRGPNSGGVNPARARVSERDSMMRFP